MSTQTKPLRREIIVVSGASTGIGAATARELGRRGFHVLAGVRRGADADALRATNIEPIMLDITDEAMDYALALEVFGQRLPATIPLRRGAFPAAGLGLGTLVIRAVGFRWGFRSRLPRFPGRRKQRQLIH